MDQPQWFYSSLAQVTAAIVGFVGGFLLLRLLEVMRAWNELRDRLERRQVRWSRAEFEERQYDQVHGLEIGPFTGERLRLSNEESVAWGELYRTIEVRATTRMPRELLFSLAAVTVIAIVFGLGPLLALDDPPRSERLLWLSTLALVLGLIASSIGLAVRRVHSELHAYELYPHTEGRVADHEMQIEGMLAREEEERRNREG